MESSIETLCRAKEQELLNKYFGNLTREAGLERPETIGEYTKDLPMKIEAEYRAYLEGVWSKWCPDGTPLYLEEQKLRELMTDADRERLESAYENAQQRTLWEKITGSNCEDVTYYKGLLFEYTKNLLIIMRHDFLEEITGNHIKCKAFEE